MNLDVNRIEHMIDACEKIILFKRWNMKSMRNL